MHDLVWAWLSIFGGLVVLIAGGEVLVRGAVRLAAVARVPPLIIGLTVVAFGTSAPELAVSVQAAFSGSSDLALGNIVGSNIFNVLFILGISALIVPLVVSNQLVRWHVPTMIVASVLVVAVGRDHVVGRADGIVLSSGLLLYVWWCLRHGFDRPDRVPSEFVSEAGPGQTAMRTILANLGLIVAGLVMLTVGSRWLIRGAVEVAESLGVSELVIGLTIVAAGTSLPEVATSIIAAIRKERDIAVGNVVGSNIFNIFCVLGISSIIAPHGIAVEEAALSFDVPLMIAVAVACLPVFLTGHVISRWEGGLFFVCYVLYAAYRVLQAVGSNMATATGIFTVFLLALLVAVTLVVALWPSRR